MGRLTKRVSNDIVVLDEPEIPFTYPACPQNVASKLADYEDAEEKGLMVRFPAPIGSEVYVYSGTLPLHAGGKRFSDYDIGTIYSYIMKKKEAFVKIKITAKWSYSYWGYHKEEKSARSKYFAYSLRCFGTTIFTSKDEVLKALENRKGEDENE